MFCSCLVVLVHAWSWMIMARYSCPSMSKCSLNKEPKLQYMENNKMCDGVSQ